MCQIWLIHYHSIGANKASNMAISVFLSNCDALSIILIILILFLCLLDWLIVFVNISMFTLCIEKL